MKDDVRDRRAAEGRRLHRPRLRGRREGPRQGRGHLRALHRGHVLPARPRRGQRRRLRLDLRRRPARHAPCTGCATTAPVRSGDLLLLDAGVETHTLYTADVTRTLPINGRFSELQRKIYDAVYEAQEAGIAAVQAGRQVPRLPRRRAARAGREARRVGPGRGPGGAGAGAGPAAPLDAARHRPHARHGRPRLRRRAHRGVRRRHAGAGHGAHRRARVCTSRRTI